MGLGLELCCIPTRVALSRVVIPWLTPWKGRGSPIVGEIPVKCPFPVGFAVLKVAEVSAKTHTPRVSARCRRIRRHHALRRGGSLEDNIGVIPVLSVLFAFGSSLG